MPGTSKAGAVEQMYLKWLCLQKALDWPAVASRACLLPWSTPSPPWPIPHCAPVHTPCLQLPVGTLGGSFKHPILFVTCLPFSWVPAAPPGSLAPSPQVFKLISEFSWPGILPESSLTLPGWLPLFRVPCVCFDHCA